MAKIDYIKLSKVRDDGKSELIVRLYISKTFRPQFRSGLFINPDRFISLDDTDRCRRYEIDIPREGTQNFIEIKDLKEVKRKFSLYLERLQAICDVTAERHKDTLTKEWIDEALRLINKDNTNIEDITYQHLVLLIEKEEKYVVKASAKTFFDLMEEYLKSTKYSEVREKNFRVLIRALMRYEKFVSLFDKERKDFKLDIETINKETIADIESFLRNEHSLLEEYPNIFKEIPATTDTKRRSPKPKPRGNNTICALFNKLRAFFNWLNEQGVTQNRPFAGYDGVTTEKYGTPYYITLEERNQIADFDLSGRPSLETQRDIFIFQCLVGCRVSDLMRLTPADIIEGELQYIAHKTKDKDPVTVKVPLNERASKLVEKYEGVDQSGRLFPFISSQNYNEAIKEIFTICEVTRMVTVIDSTTGEEDKKPINEVASSHMARRTFVGNLYKKLKDPNIICPMSGHKVGSAAFARYREVDREMRNEAVKLID